MTIDIPSPCVGTCRIRDADQRCAGCERTIDEITRWGEMDAEARLAVLGELELRRQSAARLSADAGPDSRVG